MSPVFEAHELILGGGVGVTTKCVTVEAIAETLVKLGGGMVSIDHRADPGDYAAGLPTPREFASIIFDELPDMSAVNKADSPNPGTES